MIAFALKLLQGIHQKDIPRDKREIVNELLSFNILQKRKLLKLDSKYKIGLLDINRNGTGYASLIDSNKKDILIEREDLFGANKGDLVLIKKSFNKIGRPKAKVIYILKKAFNVAVAYLSVENSKYLLKNIKTDQKIEVKVKQKELNRLPENTIFKIDLSTNKIVEVLGVLDDPNIDEKISLALYDKREEFPKSALKEARSFGDYVEKSLYAREDITHLPFCTIDPSDAKDHDDAIYYDEKNRELYVAIADVSEYVYLNGAIDKEAKNRGFSIYLPHKSIPMLPRELSENICSLKENEDRLAFVFKIKFDENARVVDEYLFEAIIKSKRKYSYERIDEFLSGDFSQSDELDKELLKWIMPLYKVTEKLKRERLKDGLEFESDEIRMKLENQKLSSIKVERETPSHGLIEDCMLLANKAAANMIDFGVFRVHDRPSFKTFNELLMDLAPLGITAPQKSKNIKQEIKAIQAQAKNLGISQFVDKMIIRSQKQAIYSATNEGHFALGFEKYTHFTSPIRRYSDLTLHRLLKAIIQKNDKFKKFILNNIESLVLKISELERESMKVEWDFYDRKFARWASENIGKEFDCVITDKKQPPIAKLDDELKGARIFLEHGNFELFEKVKVKIISVNIATTKIKGKVCTEEI